MTVLYQYEERCHQLSANGKIIKVIEEQSMDNNPSNRNKRLAFILSGITDALIGAAILLVGFGLLPVDVNDYGFENWHAIVFGGVMLFIGVVAFAYNLSRLDE